MKVRDADGMTFLMHAANPASSGINKRKQKKGGLQQPKMLTDIHNIHDGGNATRAATVARATTTGHLGLGHATTASGGVTTR